MIVNCNLYHTRQSESMYFGMVMTSELSRQLDFDDDEADAADNSGADADGDDVDDASPDDDGDDIYVADAFVAIAAATAAAAANSKGAADSSADGIDTIDDKNDGIGSNSNENENNGSDSNNNDDEYINDGSKFMLITTVPSTGAMISMLMITMVLLTATTMAVSSYLILQATCLWSCSEVNSQQHPTLHPTTAKWKHYHN